ncbi:hypothetical protein GCM10022225_18990 [Plantactinospora mayteni]|uniref:Flavin reductase n=1 Tax=Plantactinospora mayteni TaxID=566021 RepID=A0ABQ4EN57_9ACTN|nr:hypothetical protein [Plantactinospora mayteni]GIG96083.1 hypothetical protein Pma05_26560 [Plantactinospora mayteni]
MNDRPEAGGTRPASLTPDDQPAWPASPAGEPALLDGFADARRPVLSVHVPALPSWLCDGCGDLWPCPNRKLELHTEFGGEPVPLALYLAAHFVRAAQDLAGLPAGSLHRRFLGWVR